MSNIPSPETIGNAFADAIERVSPGIVTVFGRDRLPATGTVVSGDSEATTIVTASHVIEREENLTVRLADNTEHVATLLGRDLNRDLAVLRVEANGIEPVQLDTTEPRVGTLAMAVGRPWVSSLQVSFGAISVYGSFLFGGKKTRRLIHAEVTLYPGFSGGPLIGAAGNVIGINTSGELKMGSFTIPADQVARVTRDILEIGYVRMPWVGITVQQVDLPEHVAATVGDQQTGLKVLGIEDGSPSATAGLHAGDILVSIDDQPLEDVVDLQQPLCDELIGETLNFVAWRDTERHEFAVVPTTRPEQPCP